MWLRLLLELCHMESISATPGGVEYGEEPEMATVRRACATKVVVDIPGPSAYRIYEGFR